MSVLTGTIRLESNGDTDIIDLTGRVNEILRSSDISEGIVHVFAPGATMGLTTVEFENGLIKDLTDAFEDIAPSAKRYAHNERWGDGNGHSHVRSSILGPSLTVPVVDGQLVLGTWQQIVLIDFDNRPRQRELIVQVLGE